VAISLSIVVGLAILYMLPRAGAHAAWLELREQNDQEPRRSGRSNAANWEGGRWNSSSNAWPCQRFFITTRGRSEWDRSFGQQSLELRMVPAELAFHYSSYSSCRRHH
jgi:hypothetical protein